MNGQSQPVVLVPIVLVLLLGLGPASAQVSAGPSSDTDKPANTQLSPRATLADFAWLVGDWKGTLGKFAVEQSYALPRAGLMMGMLRLLDGEQTTLVEFFTLRETPEGLEFRIRHFSPALVPWEKDDAIVLKLARYDGQEAVFENPVHTRPKRTTLTRRENDAFLARSEIIRDTGETTVIEVAWTRASAPASAEIQSSRGSAAPSKNPLKPLARLTGGEWRGQIKVPNGPTFDARNVFGWSLDGQVLKFRAYAIHEGAERLLYEGLYAWHPAKNRIVFHEYSAGGSVLEGEVEAQEDDLVFTWTAYSGHNVKQYRERFRFPDADHYVSQAYRRTEGGSEELAAETAFQRVRAD